MKKRRVTRPKRTKPEVEIEYERPWLYEKQVAAIFSEARFAFIEASTKSGKTVGCLVWICEQAFFHGRWGRNFWWVAPVFGQSKIAYRRLKRFLPPEMFKANDSELTITLINGAVIWFKSGEKPDNLFGEDVYAAVMDEASRMREETYYAIRTTLSKTRGPIRFIGNVKGRKNWFYKLARRAESGEDGYSYAKIIAKDAVDAGILHEDEVKEARRDLPEAVFRELYLAEPCDDGANPFGFEYIRGCTVDGLSPGEPVAWGWDLAKSMNWTVGIGLTEEGRCCRFERFRMPWQETVDLIINETDGKPALVDSTGVGDDITERLQRRGGPNFEGFVFTGRSRQQLLEGLAAAIQHYEVAFPEGQIPHELEWMEFVVTKNSIKYEAPEGMSDDCVMALALAVRCLNSTSRMIQVFV